MDVNRFYQRDSAETSRPISFSISQVGRCLMARNFRWDAAVCLPRSPANTIGIPALWTDRHVLLAFLGEEYLAKYRLVSLHVSIS